ncbi:MAG TPA: hypothetical protein VH593_03715, partial [Ktedonobacteraceae bacterium]
MDIQKSSEQEIKTSIGASLFELELEAPAELEQVGTAPPTVSPFRESLQRFRRDKRAMISLITLIVVFFLALVFPPLYQHLGVTLDNEVAPGFVLHVPSTQYHSPDYQDAARLHQYPSSLHWLGTDDSGQDLLAR